MTRASAIRFRKPFVLIFILFTAFLLSLFLSKLPRLLNRLPQVLDSTQRVIKFSFTSSVKVQNNNELSAQPLSSVRLPIASTPLRVSSINPRYFTDDRGKAIYLTGSHTWANLQDSGQTDPPPPFDYEKYLDFLLANHHNFFRLYVWEQARWTAESTADYWVRPLPYLRSIRETALDGKQKFDLTRFNQSYFDRLRQRLILAKQKGIYVSVMLFSGWGIEGKQTSGNPWNGHPYHRSNNINNIDGDPNKNGRGEETHTLQVPQITALQEAYVKKIIDTVNDLDNVLYEISNESHNQSHSWQYHFIDYIKNYEAQQTKQHPVGMTIEFPDGDNGKLFASAADWISPKTDINYPPVAEGKKVIISDTDHLCGICGDRQWVWKSFTRGENPIFMDAYDGGVLIAPVVPSNPLNYQPWIEIRRNLGYTLTYANRINLATMKPEINLASTGYCLASSSSPNAEYLVYLPAGGAVTVDLSAVPKPITAEWFNPSTGVVFSGISTTGGGHRTFTAPFAGDAVLYVKAS